MEPNWFHSTDGFLTRFKQLPAFEKKDKRDKVWWVTIMQNVVHTIFSQYTNKV